MNKILEEENLGKIKQKRDLRLFLHLVIVKPISWPCFCFIKIFMIGLTISLNKTDSLAINKILIIKKKVAISFIK